MQDVEIIADFPRTVPEFFLRHGTVKNPWVTSLHYVGDIPNHLQTVLFIPRWGQKVQLSIFRIVLLNEKEKKWRPRIFIWTKRILSWKVKKFINARIKSTPIVRWFGAIFRYSMVFLAPNVFVFFVYFFGGLECVGHSFAYVAHLWFLRDIWIRTQSAAVASWRATDLATHPSKCTIFLTLPFLSFWTLYQRSFWWTHTYIIP
jgi:hypothetical protein